MEKLEKLIRPQVYGWNDLRHMGWKAQDIEKYCHERRLLWEKGVVVFKKLFSSFGQLFIYKEYDYQKHTMKVSVCQLVDYNTKILCENYHVDPLFALAECAKNMDNEDDFLSNLLGNMKV